MKGNNKRPIIRLLDNIRINDKRAFFICGIYTLVSLTVPLISIALPKVLIGYLTGPSPNLWGIIWISAGFFAAGAILNFFEQFLMHFGYPRFTALRLDYLKDQMAKLLNMDYKYMESSAFFEKWDMAFNSTNSNDNGVEGIYHKLFELPNLIIIVLILSVFIGLKSPLILLAIAINIAATSLIAVAVKSMNIKRRNNCPGTAAGYIITGKRPKISHTVKMSGCMI